MLKPASKLWWAVLTLLVLVGCGSPPSGSGSGGAATAKALPFEGLRLRLVVAGDEPLAEAIGRLKAEWRATAGADLEIETVSEADLLQGNIPETDVMIYPAYDLGVLVEGDRLRPLPDRELSNSDVAWEEIFEADKTHDAGWASTTYAFPFGSPTMVCWYRKDLFEKLDLKPPQTWAEYQKIATRLADREELGDAAPPAGAPWCGTMEPLAKNWAGLTLLARVAAYAKHRNHYSTLFDMESMEPLIAGPPFVRALDELKAAKEYMLAEGMETSPKDVHEAFVAGRCGMALTWTSPAFAENEADLSERASGKSDKEFDIGFTVLPGSEQVFNPKTNRWDARRGGESSHVTLVGASGRLGSVMKSSSQPEAAFRLLGWLSSPQWSERVSTATAQATLFRRSQLKSAGEWVDPRIDAPAAVEYAEAVEQALGSSDFFGAPRIAGRERYLAALDEAVRSVLAGDATSQDALVAAADEWRKITADVGLDEQRGAYRRSLGLR